MSAEPSCQRRRSGTGTGTGTGTKKSDKTQRARPNVGRARFFLRKLESAQGFG